MRPGLTHDLWRTRKSASHSTESIIEDVSVTNLHRNVTSHKADFWNGVTSELPVIGKRPALAAPNLEPQVLLIVTIRSDFPQDYAGRAERPLG